MFPIIKIDKIGHLHEQIKGKMKAKICPYANGKNCGDWCPMFRLDEYSLELCKTKYRYDKLTDER